MGAFYTFKRKMLFLFSAYLELECSLIFISDKRVHSRLPSLLVGLYRQFPAGRPSRRPTQGSE